LPENRKQRKNSADIFVAEAQEKIQAWRRALSWRAVRGPERGAELFHAATQKGMSATMGYEGLDLLCHAWKTPDTIAAGSRAVSDELVYALARAGDSMDRMVGLGSRWC